MKNKKNVIIAIMLCVAVLMATGYAYFATRLNINATGNITSQWNVYFSNISSGTAVGSASNAKTPSVTGTTATMDVNLALPGDSMTYELTLTNGGTIGAIVEDIKAESVGSSAINYSISGIKIGDKLASGANKTITIKIEYDPNTTGQPSKTNKTLTITIDTVQDIGQTITSKDPVIEDTTVCKLASDSTVAHKEYGAKYDCKVDPNKNPYTFYLLDNNEDGTSDLIMNANINAAGEAVVPGVTADTGGVPWLSTGYNTDGPVTAMTYLYNATKSWTNVEPLNYEYYDKLVQNEVGNLYSAYESFISVNGIGVITKGDGSNLQQTIGTNSEPLRARMPIYSTDNSITEISSKTDNNGFLFGNVDPVCLDTNPLGYWTLSTYDDLTGGMAAFSVMCTFVSNQTPISNGYGTGVRPVITVKL